MFWILGLGFGTGVWFKYSYDLRENAGGTVETATQLKHVFQVIPGLVLGFFEISVLTAVSVAISTRLPMLVNLISSTAIFFLGHLTPVLVTATEGGRANELVHFMAQLFSFILPDLEYFNVSPAISTGAVIPWVGYVLPALGYWCGCKKRERPCCSRSSCSRTATWREPRSGRIGAGQEGTTTGSAASWEVGGDRGGLCRRGRGRPCHRRRARSGRASSLAARQVKRSSSQRERWG